jgi:hypothetical protein
MEKAEDVKQVVKDGPSEKFWKEQGVTPLPLVSCNEGEEGFSWSEFINGLGQRVPRKANSICP